MSLCKYKAEKLECFPRSSKEKKWLKNQMNRYIRRLPIEPDDKGYKTARKPTIGWEY